MLPVPTLQETAWFNKLKEIVSQISVYQFAIGYTSKVILPHVLENTSLVLVSPPPLYNALCHDRKFECNCQRLNCSKMSCFIPFSILVYSPIYLSFGSYVSEVI